MEQSISIELKNSFTDWVNQYSDTLYSWAFHKTSNKEMAEDIVQDTFYSAYKSLEKFEGKSSPKTWLLSILNNKIIDYYRSHAKDFVSIDSKDCYKENKFAESAFNRKEHWIENNEELWSEKGDLLNNQEFVNALESCYDHLPSNWKVAIQAKYIFDEDSNDICQELSISPSNYWKLIQRSKVLLKKCLETNWLK